MASFGFSIGDVVTVGTVAWRVYRACYTATSEFRGVSFEVESLHTAIAAVLEEFPNTDAARARTSSSQLQRLHTIVDHCQSSLEILEKLVLKYGSLATTERRKRDILGFAKEDLVTLRSKIIVHTNAINVFLSTLGSGRLGRIENKLDHVIQEIQSGVRNEAPLIIATDEYSAAADFQWSLLRLELSGDGFDATDIEHHRLWFENRLRPLHTDHHAPSTLEGLGVARNHMSPRHVSGQIYQYLGDVALETSDPEVLVRHGEYVFSGEERGHLGISGLTLECQTLYGLYIGNLLCSDLAIVPDSRLVDGQVKIADFVEKPVPQIHERGSLLSAKTDPDTSRGEYLERSANSNAILDIASPGLTKTQEASRVRSATGTSNITTRPYSRTGSIRSVISEYDSDGRHVKTKTITMTHNPPNNESKLFRNHSAPATPASWYRRNSRSDSGRELRHSRRQTNSEATESHPPIAFKKRGGEQRYQVENGTLPLDDHSLGSPNSRSHSNHQKLSDKKRRSIGAWLSTISGDMNLRSISRKPEGTHENCACGYNYRRTHDMLEARTRQLDHTLRELDRLGLTTWRRLGPLRNTENEIETVEGELSAIRANVTQMLAELNPNARRPVGRGLASLFTRSPRKTRYM